MGSCAREIEHEHKTRSIPENNIGVSGGIDKRWELIEWKSGETAATEKARSELVVLPMCRTPSFNTLFGASLIQSVTVSPGKLGWIALSFLEKHLSS